MSTLNDNQFEHMTSMDSRLLSGSINDAEDILNKEGLVKLNHYSPSVLGNIRRAKCSYTEGQKPHSHPLNEMVPLKTQRFTGGLITRFPKEAVTTSSKIGRTLGIHLAIKGNGITMAGSTVKHTATFTKHILFFQYYISLAI